MPFNINMQEQALQAKKLQLGNLSTLGRGLCQEPDASADGADAAFPIWVGTI